MKKKEVAKGQTLSGTFPGRPRAEEVRTPNWLFEERTRATLASRVADCGTVWDGGKRREGEEKKSEGRKVIQKREFERRGGGRVKRVS